MKNYLSVFALVVLFTSVCVAQSKFKAGLSIGPAISEKVGLGTDANVQLNIYQNINANLTFEHFISEGSKPLYSIIPSLNYTFNNLPVKIYLEAGLGMAFSSKTTEIIYVSESVSSEKTVGGKSNIFKLGTGLYFPISDKTDLNFNVTYLHPESYHEQCNFGIGFLYHI